MKKMRTLFCLITILSLCSQTMGSERIEVIHEDNFDTKFNGEMFGELSWGVRFAEGVDIQIESTDDGWAVINGKTEVEFLFTLFNTVLNKSESLTDPNQFLRFTWDMRAPRGMPLFFGYDNLGPGGAPSKSSQRVGNGKIQKVVVETDPGAITGGNVLLAKFGFRNMFIGNHQLELDRFTLEKVTDLTFGDFNEDAILDVADVDALIAVIAADTNDAAFDLNDDQLVDSKELDLWVTELKNTYYGDSDLDGEFASRDLVNVFVAGEYEDGIEANSTWAEGDWNGDREFTSSDLVTAFLTEGYELGPRVANVVPEPASHGLALFGFLSIAMLLRFKVR